MIIKNKSVNDLQNLMVCLNTYHNEHALNQFKEYEVYDHH